MGIDDNFIKFDFVMHLKTKRIGKIVEINRFFGWCKVLWSDGIQKHYEISTKQQTIRRLTREEVADLRLKQETLRITNNWGE